MPVVLILWVDIYLGYSSQGLKISSSVTCCLMCTCNVQQGHLFVVVETIIMIFKRYHTVASFSRYNDVG